LRTGAFRIATALVVASTLLSMTGCGDLLDELTTRDLTITLDALPEYYAQYKAGALTYKLNNSTGSYEVVDTIQLGTVGNADKVETSITVDSTSEFITFFLDSVSSEETHYFLSYDLARITGNSIKVSWWLNYPYYVNYSVERFGLSNKHLVEVDGGQDIVLDFMRTGYSCGHIADARGRSFDLAVAPTEYGADVDVLVADSFGALANLAMEINLYQYALTLSDGNMGHTYTVTNWASDDLYFMVAPKYSNSAHLLTGLAIDDVTERISQTFQATKAITLDGGETLYIASETPYNSTADNKIRKWVVDTGEVTVLASFDQAISRFDHDGTILYVSTGSLLWSVDTVSAETTLRWVAPYTISSLAVADNFLFVSYGGGPGTFAMVRKTDFQTVSTRAEAQGGPEYVYEPADHRLYYICNYLDDIVYLEFDPASETITSFGDSPYQGEYPLSNPIRRFGDGMRVVTRTGHVFSIDDTTVSKIKYHSSMGQAFFDIAFFDTFMVTLDYSLVYPWNDLKVRVRSMTSPYGAIRTVADLPGETGIRAFRTAEGLVVVSVDTAKRVHVRKYSLATLAGG